jgi:hypothetical protein
LCGQEIISKSTASLIEEYYLQPLWTQIVHRQSIALRLKGDVDSSEHVIKIFFLSLNTTSNSLAPGDLVPLYLLQANNHAYRFSFSQAHEEIKRWLPTRDLSKGYEHFVWDQILCVGRFGLKVLINEFP